jgi:TonB family protein
MKTFLIKTMLMGFWFVFCFTAMVDAQSSTTTVPQTETPQWEYKTVHADKEVNDLVTVGWELVTMTSDQQQNNYLMKRRKGKVDPTLLYDIQPQYTKEAFRKHIQGDVVMSLTVTKTGSATDVKVVKSLDPGLDASAIAAVQQWRWRPATLDGQPADHTAKVATHFKILPGQKPKLWFFFIYRR